ncbi:MAG TPA: DUF2231 domain-containing protein [Thermoanaerobaculia bacterium]|nr:DUF2231 domain-containing protein [Thermoanaerobaculia bacterium]
MRAKARLFGHPIHQMLIVVPLGLLGTSLVVDIAHLATGNPLWGTISYWLIVAGILSGLVAAPFGLIDWLAIPTGTRAKRIGLLHGGGNVVVLLLFVVSWWMRRDDPGNPEGLAIGLSTVAVLLALVTGWLGGELVDRLGVGVDEGANLNAPSSLSGRPAAEPAPLAGAGAAPRTGRR